MKGQNNYTPRAGETCLISGPNCDDEDGYVYQEYKVLWLNDVFILYGLKDCWPTLNKIEYVSIRCMMSEQQAQENLREQDEDRQDSGGR